MFSSKQLTTLPSNFLSHSPSFSLYPNMHLPIFHPLRSSFPITASSNLTFLHISTPPKKQNKIKNTLQISHQNTLYQNPTPLTVSHKLKHLVSEFKSLPQPIDRVKRLLQYASIIPLFDETARVEVNRVKGCTAEVWLEVRVDDEGRMRFRVDSDSEITKGFCSCLIWLLDGAEPKEVLELKVEDLVEMNIGLPVNSRVNTWSNVLVSMHKRTKCLVGKRSF